MKFKSLIYLSRLVFSFIFIILELFPLSIFNIGIPGPRSLSFAAWSWHPRCHKLSINWCLICLYNIYINMCAFGVVSNLFKFGWRSFFHTSSKHDQTCCLADCLRVVGGFKVWFFIQNPIQLGWFAKLMKYLLYFLSMGRNQSTRRLSQNPCWNFTY